MSSIGSGSKSNFGFALPTVLVLSMVLLIMGLSVFQVGASISRALSDQQWNRMAKEAAQAGVSYTSSCLRKNPNTVWTGVLKPNTDCLGTSLGAGVSEYYATDTSASAANKWRSTFVVSTLSSGSYGEPRAKVTGKLELLSATGVVVTKTYTSESSVILNIEQSNPFDAVQVSANGYCTLRSDDSVWCQNVAGSGGTPTKFILPGTYKAVDFRLIYNTSLVVTGVCVLGSDGANSRMYCAGENTNGQFGTGGGNVAYPNPTASSSTFGSVNVAELWRGLNINANICVIATDANTYCAGANLMGTFGNGGTASSGTPVLAFNQAPLTTGGIRAKTVLGHISAVPESVSSLSLAASPIAVTSRRCVISTDSQVFCAGVCSQSVGGILFGTALAGSGTNACGRSPAPAPAYGVNPAPNDWGAAGSLLPLVAPRNSCHHGGATDTSASCYYVPVKYQLPAGVTVLDVSIKVYPAQVNLLGIITSPSASSFCVYTSNDKIYCTLNPGSGTKAYEPTDLTL